MPSEKDISPLEQNILNIAVKKLNFVSQYGRGESLSEEEMAVFRYWLANGNVRAISSAPCGEIYEINVS